MDENNQSDGGVTTPTEPTTQNQPATLKDQAQSAQSPATAPACSVCGKTTAGFRCASCGEETSEHDPNHACGGDQCQPKCVDCGDADSKCTCPPQTQTPA